jgi:hypothetical protein
VLLWHSGDGLAADRGVGCSAGPVAAVGVGAAVHVVGSGPARQRVAPTPAGRSARVVAVERVVAARARQLVVAAALPGAAEDEVVADQRVVACVRGQRVVATAVGVDGVVVPDEDLDAADRRGAGGECVGGPAVFALPWV